MTTIATLFSGGEGVGVGAKQAGLDHLWGVEYDDAIAQVARNNGFNTITGNVMDTALMMTLLRPDVLHASPVCKNASNAKANGEESPLDIATADATCAYISHFRPDIFTLENVWGYRTFEAFAHILICLKRNGYTVDYWHLNAADYGVPQTRRRLILVARFHGKPIKPLATHARPEKLTPMFDTRQPWIGWYAAIEDLIDTLEYGEFQAWQIPTVNALTDVCLVDCQYEYGNDDPDRPAIHKYKHEPFATLAASGYNKPIRMFCGPGLQAKIINTRCRARLQSIPDWYQLPSDYKLACTVIGNAVPPLLYQRVIEAQL